MNNFVRAGLDWNSFNLVAFFDDLEFIYALQDKSKDSKANPLSVKNIGGVFVVLLGGLLVAIIVAVLEFCWNSRKNSQIDRQSLCSEMAEELR